MRAELKAMAVLVAGSGLTVYVGEAPGDALPPYVVLVPQRNADEQARLTGPMVSEVVQVAARSVGVTWDQASWVDERLDGVLRPGGRGVCLVVPGRVTGPVERRGSDVGPDDDAGRVWSVVSSFRFWSRPI